MAGQVLPHRADRDAVRRATDERQRKMVYSKHETAGAESATAVMTEIERYEKAKGQAPAFSVK